MDFSPNAPQISDGALASGITHPTGSTQLKCGNKIVGWGATALRGFPALSQVALEALRNPTPRSMLGCAPLHPTYV